MGYASGPRVGTEYHTGNVGTNPVFGGSLLRTDGTVGFTSGGSCLMAAGGTLSWNTRSAIKSSADGNLTLFNAAQTAFTRLQFGGISNSFVSLVTSGAIALACQLADGSGYAGFYAQDFRATGASAAVAANVISYGGTTQTTVGASGAASALPAQPLGYIIGFVAAVKIAIPYYNG